MEECPASAELFSDRQEVWGAGGKTGSVISVLWAVKSLFSAVRGRTTLGTSQKMMHADIRDLLLHSQP